MTFEIVTIPRINEIVNPILEKYLHPLGFEYISELKWVRGKYEPIRHTFELQQWKGGHVAPRYGLSIDFIPHISGTSVKWHRTNKSSKPDLILDTHDKSMEFSYHSGEIEIIKNAPFVLEKAVSYGEKFWNSCKNENDLLTAFEYVRNYYDQGLPIGRSKFEMYVPHMLAHAFIQAKLGNKDESIQELDSYIKKSKLKNSTAEKLKELLLTINA